MKNLFKKFSKVITGILCGLLNGLFGSGGGVVAVPALELTGLEPRKSHATSVAVIFFLSLMSVIAYGLKGNLDFKSALNFIPWGVGGAVLGSLLLKNVPNSLLRRIFGAVVLISAVRLFIQ